MMDPSARCDLHIHTHFSDGRASPEEVVRHAASAGLHTVAITDHDNAQGVRAAVPVAAETGVRLIPAIELTCRWELCQAPPGQTDVDLLGYCLDLDRPALHATEQAALADIRQRIARCCTLLTAAGYPVTLDDVLTQNPRYTGIAPLAHALVQKGLAADWPSALELIDAGWRQVPPSATTVEQAIAAVHAAGGVAVLAHPLRIPWKGGLLPLGAIAALVDAGLDGLEVYHHSCDEGARDFLLACARQFGLLVTGGSDEHGWRGDLARVGTQPVSVDMVEALLARASQG